jgi:hypothetical protein
MPAAGFILVELLFLASTHLFGGPPWTVIGVLAFLGLSFSGSRGSGLAILAPSLLWLVLARLTGNRELFFPYTIYLAAFVATELSAKRWWLGVAGAAGVIAAFMAIRTMQNAGTRVLLVELAIAAAILLAIFAAIHLSRRTAGRRFQIDAAIVAAASLLAYAGLAC